jgi:hypothetical protein
MVARPRRKDVDFLPHPSAQEVLDIAGKTGHLEYSECVGSLGLMRSTTDQLAEQQVCVNRTKFDIMVGVHLQIW